MIYREDLCDVFADHRGDLIQFITQRWLTEHKIALGQVYLLTFNNVNVVRGNHYHKRSTEVFCLVSGAVQIRLFDIQTRETKDIFLDDSGSSRKLITVYPFVTHAIKSLTPNCVLVSLSSEEYTPSSEDKYPYIILE